MSSIELDIKKVLEIMPEAAAFGLSQVNIINGEVHTVSDYDIEIDGFDETILAEFLPRKMEATQEQIHAMLECFETVLRNEPKGTDLYQAAFTGLGVLMGNFIFMEKQ